MSEAPVDLESELVDLTDLPLSELVDLQDGVLARSLRRIEQETNCPDQVVAGFQAVA